MSSLPWTPEDDASEVDRLIAESQRPAPPGPWVREATPDDVELLRAALDAHRRALDAEAERVVDLVVLVAVAFGAAGVLVGYLLALAVRR